MKLTLEQLEEGRRLLAASLKFVYGPGVMDVSAEKPSFSPELDLAKWLYEHADALLAEPTMDVEAIKRDAMMEFAEASISELSAKAKQLYRVSEEASPIADVMLAGIGKGQEFAAETIRKLAAARGVNLDEKP